MVDDKNPEEFNGSFDKDDEEDDESGVFSSKKSKSRSTSPSKKISASKTEQDSEDDITVQKKYSSFPKQKTDKLESKKFYDSHDIEQDEQTEELEDSEMLSDEEKKDATLVIVDNLTEQAISELEESENDSSEEYQAIARAVFLEELREQVTENEKLSGELIDDSFNEVLRDLEISEDGLDNTVTEDLDDNFINKSTDANIEREQDSTSEKKEQKASVQSFDTPQQTFGPPEQQSSQVPLAGSTQPPPSSPTGPPIPPVGIPTSSIRSPIPPADPSISQNSLSPNTAPTVYTPRRRRPSGVLVGGIVGYIIGRRGGRKRTEKRLNPVISKLEKQVGEMHAEITKKEEKIRELARKNYQSTKKGITKDKLVKVRERKKEVRAENLRRIELEENPRVEKLGKFSLPAMKMYVERRLMDGTEKNKDRKPIETMTVEELVKYASNILIDGSSVKNYFELGRLNTNSLRDIVKDYVRGGNYQNIFWKELLPDKNEILLKRNNLESVHQNQISDSKTAETKRAPLGVGDELIQEKVGNITNLTRPDIIVKTDKKQTKIYYWVVLIIIIALLVFFIIAS